MISVKILADSINPFGRRITSWLLKYPRFIHSEFMTHRVFSRNAASSRARPFPKLMQDILEDPAMPEYWGEELKGMASGKALDGDRLRICLATWKLAAQKNVSHAKELAGVGLHKSLCNRLIENFGHITVLATATDHRNFFALRAHPAAMPEFQVLAYRMLAQYLDSKPQSIQWGDWHMPYFEGSPVSAAELVEGVSTRLKVATARCARLSYLTFDGEYSLEADERLHDQLAANGHMSPFEHCARAEEHNHAGQFSNFDYANNWSGWLQYRKMFATENRTNIDLHETLATKPDWLTL